MLLIVFVTFGAHVAGNVAQHLLYGLLVPYPFERTDDLLDIFAVMFQPHLFVGIVHAARYGCQRHRGGNGIGRIHVELEIGHDEHVVPEFVGEFRGVPQEGVEVTHHVYHHPCLAVAFIAVFDGHQVVHHLVYVPAVLRQLQVFPVDVIVFFHKMNH